MLGGGLLAGLFCLLAADQLFPLHLPEKRSDFATLVVDRQGEPLRIFADAAGVWRYQVALAQVSPRYIEALLAYEDRYFYQHPGVNPLSLLRATYQYLRSGEVISGGSTLTMQVARILHPHPRTMAGKLQQILRALQLEWHLSKDEILSLYLNYAPFGGTVEGVQAASLQYLRKPASELRLAEAALLVVLPQAPSRYRPDRYPQRAEQARNKVLTRLQDNQVWPHEDIVRARQEKVAVWPLHTPVLSPLLSRHLHQSYPQQRLIRTTLDGAIQIALADTVKFYTAALPEPVSAAALLLDNHNHQVLAYVGSADFSSESRAGHVDMIRAVRSPGSTLKPFLYGLALDANLIHSESLLADVPRVATTYRPGNFSLGFSGPVAASEALQRSLNLPFVQLLEAYGAQQFVNKLAHVGAELEIPGGRANPAVILGGAGSSLLQLVQLYSSLANQGLVYPVSAEPEVSAPPRRLLSPDAAWITWQTLQDVAPPREFQLGLSAQQLPAVGWKTGTSWDHRDVWAIGVTARYTLGVWLGRPDGKPMAKTTGRQLAGPLLFKLLQQLPVDKEIIPAPATVQSVSVCWPDGRRASLVEQGCDLQRLAYTISGVTPRTLPTQPARETGAAELSFYNPLTTVLLDAESGLQVSRACQSGEIRAQVMSFWPQALEPWLSYDQRRTASIPAFDPACKIIAQTARALRISGINEGQVYHAPDAGPLQVEVRVEGGTGILNWYLNGQPLESSRASQKLHLPGKGQYELLVQDKQGTTGRVTFLVI